MHLRGDGYREGCHRVRDLEDVMLPTGVEPLRDQLAVDGWVDK